MKFSYPNSRAWLFVASAILALAGPIQAQTQTQSGFIYNGITHVSFQPAEYATSQGVDSRTALAATNASWAGVLVTQYQANASATVISADSQRTPTDQAVTQAINEFHAKGMKVMLKPHVDSEDGAWRGTFQPTDVDAWFQSFTNFVVHYAQMAQSLNVELLCFGTEYVQLSGAANRTRWAAVIAAIRQVYTGKLVYAANATFGGDEFTSVSFWDLVDLIGIDGYFPLTNHADPTLAELVAAWRSNQSGEDILADVQNFSDAHQKPLIFTEVGYKSVAGANTQPFNFTFPGAFDLTEQQNCYSAWYTTWSPQNSWMLGVFWWAWPVQPPAANDTDYNPRGKPVISVLQTFQGPPSGAATFNLAVNPVSMSVVQGSSASAVVAINPSGGFSSPVTLTVSGLPAGFTVTPNPTTVSTATATLTIGVATSVATGTTATAAVTGSGGGVTSSTNIKISVVAPDFSLTASPSQTNVRQGGTATSSVNITRIGAFAGAVTFTASNLPSGVTASFSPASASGTSSTVTFTATSSAALISSSVLITGTSGGLTHTTNVNLTVQPPLNDFSLSADSPTINLGGTATGNVVVTPQGIFNGSVTLGLSGVPGGVTASFSPNPTTSTSTLTFVASSSAALGTATLNLTGTSGSITHSILIHLTVNQVQNPDFSLSGTPATVTQGASATSTVTVTPLGGFTGAVALSASGLPPGVTATFNPTSTTGTSTLTFAASTSATTGTSNVTITGVSGTLTRMATISLTVNPIQIPNFSLTGTAATVVQGATSTSTITVTPSGGFAGTVALSASGLPSGVTATFNPTSTTGTSTLTFSATTAATTGTSNVTITGTSGTLTRMATISLTVNPVQNLSLTGTNATVVQGATAKSTITILGAGGFTGTVALTVAGLPSGVTAAFSPNPATTTSTLTFTAANTAPTGATNVTITGVSGTLTLRTTIALTVSPASTGNGGVTVATVINANGPWFDDQGVKVSNTTAITALSLTITVQNTGGLTFNGQYNTVGGSIMQTHASAATITYQFSLAAGQTLSPGSYLFDAQMGGSGTAHVTSGDTFTVTYTTGGQTFTQSGHF